MINELIIFTVINLGLSLIIFLLSKNTNIEKIWVIEYIYLFGILCYLMFNESIMDNPAKIVISIFAIIAIVLSLFEAFFYFRNGFGNDEIIDTRVRANNRFYNPVEAWKLRFVTFLCLFAFEYAVNKMFGMFDIPFNIFLVINTLIPAVLHAYGPFPKKKPGEDDNIPLRDE